MDLFHLQQLTGNVSRQMETLLPYVGHIQIAQVGIRMPVLLFGIFLMPTQIQIRIPISR
jgi:hypothetical protein